jgi:hypothetical protein
MDRFASAHHGRIPVVKMYSDGGFSPPPSYRPVQVSRWDGILSSLSDLESQVLSCLRIMGTWTTISDLRSLLEDNTSGANLRIALGSLVEHSLAIPSPEAVEIQAWRMWRFAPCGGCGMLPWECYCEGV